MEKGFSQEMMAVCTQEILRMTSNQAKVNLVVQMEAGISANSSMAKNQGKPKVFPSTRMVYNMKGSSWMGRNQDLGNLFREESFFLRGSSKMVSKMVMESTIKEMDVFIKAFGRKMSSMALVSSIARMAANTLVSSGMTSLREKASANTQEYVKNNLLLLEKARKSQMRNVLRVQLFVVFLKKD